MNTNCYIAGPMRGYHRFNFPAFFAMAEKLKAQGFNPINPAELDIRDGYDPTSTPENHNWNEYPPGFSAHDVVDRDLDAIKTCEYYILLPGWEKSVGAKAEKGVLDWRGTKRLETAPQDQFVLANGYRPLEKGETICTWDEYFSTSHSAWLPTDNVGLTFQPCSVISEYRRPTPLFKFLKFDKTVNAVTVGTNPKDAIGSAKPNLALVPPALIIWVAKAMENGARKYGPANWRDEDKKVRKTVYIAAALRHLLSLLDGEDLAQDSGLPHEAHAAACMGILLDAAACGTLIDDRSKAGPASKLITQLTEKK